VVVRDRLVDSHLSGIEKIELPPRCVQSEFRPVCRLPGGGGHTGSPTSHSQYHRIPSGQQISVKLEGTGGSAIQRQ
jgi:hypothetical protein